jgi:two-component system OmpR family response regulator
MRIALIEPDLRHAERVNRLLFAGGHSCQHFVLSAPFFDWATTQTCDLLITENWTGDLPAEDIIPRARAILPGLPAIVVLTLPRESQIVACLQAGADDCMQKPVRGPEMLARVDALLRRAGARRPANRSRDTFGDYSFDATRGIARFADQVVALTPKELRFALLLFSNIARPVSRAHIFETVWARERHMKSRTLDTHASRVRTKLQLHPERGYLLMPLYGYGYQLDKVSIETPAERATIRRAPRGKDEKITETL